MSHSHNNRRVRVPFFGRHYHYAYGYPWRYAIPAELAWRVEHLPWKYEGQVFAPLARWGYVQRKTWERRGYAAGPGRELRISTFGRL